MDVFEVKINATIQGTLRVIADNERDAAKRAELMFRNDNNHEIVDVRLDVSPDGCGSTFGANR